MLKDPGLCNVRAVDMDEIRANVRRMGGISGHVRVLHRNLHPSRNFGVRHGCRFYRLRRCTYGKYTGFIHRKNVYRILIR